MIARKTDLVGSGSDEIAADVEGGVGAEDDTGGVHQVEVGVRLDQAIDDRGIAADDPTENVNDRRMAEEIGHLTHTQPQPIKGVK
nr:hypothetical protein [Spirulina major]